MYSSSKFSSMMFSSLMVVVMLQMLLLQTAEAQVDVSVSPAQIDVGLSTSLDLNCTFSMSSSSMAAIVSLTVVRENNTELASITTFSNHQANVISSEGITADGVINPGGQSYIHLHWDYPTDTQNGTYLCTTREIDIIGHDTETSNISVISVNQPDFQDLLNELRRMKQEMQQLQTYITQLENNVSSLSVQENEFDLLSVFLLPPLSYNNTRYLVSKAGFQDFNETMTICKAYGGILAEVNDLDEYHAIQDYLKTLPSDLSNVYLGGTDEGHDGKWVLPSSGEELPVVDWYPEREPFTGDLYNCLSLSGFNDWRMWSYYCTDDPGVYRLTSYDRYMCEI